MINQAQTQANIGRTVELPFREFVIMVNKPSARADLQWMLYRNDGVTSALEWDIASSDLNIIYNTICAQFPEADLSLKTSAKLGAAGVHLDALSEEPASPRSEPAKVSDVVRKGKATMGGTLTPMQLAAVVQSITLGAMTGKLEILGSNDIAELFFKEGKPYHCQMRAMEGDQAVIELVSWESGDYSFFPDAASDKQTVTHRLDQLLMEGTTLVDQYKGLEKAGMSLEAYVSRVRFDITEAQFEQIVAQGIPADLNFQKILYQAVDGKSTLLEILRRFPFPKRDWVPVFFNLANCQLIVFSQTPPGQAPNVTPAQPAVEPMPIDWQRVRTAERTLTRSDTGIYSYPALLLFLEKEFARNELFNRPFCLVVLDIGTLKADGQSQPLNSDGLKRVAQRIEKLKRKTDLIAHFEMFDLAILLPETPLASARSFLVTLTETLYKSEIVPGVSNDSIRLDASVAAIPEECKSLEVMLALAKPKKH